MGVISCTEGLALWVLLAGQRDRRCGVISWTAGQVLWVLLAGQRDRCCGCY